MADKVENVPTSVDPKLEMTDERGLKDLNKAFDSAFGPKEGSTPEPEPKGAKGAKGPSSPPGAPEAPPRGHHAPVEVKPAEKAPEEPKGALNLLGEPEYVPRRRERKPVEFDDAEIPTAEEADKKTTAFPGRDVKTGKFVKGGATKPEKGEEKEGEPETDAGEEADPEVDAIQAKANAHPMVKEGIKQLKAIARARRAEIKALVDKSSKLSSELETIKATGLSSELKTELDKLRSVSQRFDLLNDEQFKAKYEEPIEAAGDRLTKFCVELSNSHPDLVKWAEETKKFGYKNVAVDYWDKEIIPKIESVINQQRVAALAADLHSKIDERNRMVTDFASSPDKITEYRQQQAIEYYSNYQKEAQSESDMLVAQIGDWAKLQELDKAKSAEERALFEEHNKRTEGYKTLFEKTMGDIMHGGPRKHVRIAAQAVYGMEIDRQLKDALSDLEALQADYDALKAQYARITRTRAIPGRTGGAESVKPRSELSTQDARSALKEYFGGSGS